MSRAHSNRWAIQQRDNERQRRSRRDQNETDRWICAESRSSDRKRGLSNDMTRVFIRDLIQHGCCYCGETQIRMTLDRIDNALGHTTANVVPACVRCNYARRDMPYDAWLIVAKGMRTAREAGLFGTWTGGPHKHEVRVAGRSTQVDDRGMTGSSPVNFATAP